ncbi:MAG: DUF4431 domain-containing protein [Chitinophagaceae bacterium]
MKNSIVKVGVIFFSFCLLAGCNSPSKENKVSNQEDTIAVQTEIIQENPTEKKMSSSDNQTDYSFEPAVSVITGTISKEVFYGAPGFGENPATDQKEEQYLMLLDKPVNVNGLNVSEEDSEDESTRTRKGVTKIQLLYDKDSIDMGMYLGSTVQLTGTFFGAHTGHHHTEVVMDVQKVEK